MNRAGNNHFVTKLGCGHPIYNQGTYGKILIAYQSREPSEENLFNFAIRNMKSQAPFFFTLLYLVAMIRPVYPLADFVINQDYIAEFLCINTDKPEMECNGKCYLSQMLQEQNNQKEESLPSIKLSEYPIGFVLITHIPKKIDFVPQRDFVHSQIDHYSYLYNSSDFHPPCPIL